MKILGPLVFFVCAFASAHSQLILSLAPKIEPIKHELAAHKLAQTFQDDAATADERRAYLMLHHVFRSSDEFWHRTAHREPLALSRRDVFAQPYSFKLFNSNATVQLKREVVVWKLNLRDRIAIKELPYHAFGFAFSRKY